MSEGWGYNSFVQDGTVYYVYSAADRGVKFLMGYYPVLERAPRGRDERDGFHLWIRPHDEYERA